MPPQPGHFRVFLGYCLPFVVVYLLLLVAGLWLWSGVTFWEEAEDSVHWRAQTQGTHALLQDRYATTEPAQWPALTTQLQKRFAYPLRLQTLAEATADLSTTQATALREGKHVVSRSTTSYERLHGSSQVVVLGDFLDYPEPEAPWQETAEEVVHQLMLLLNIMLAIALPLYFLVYRVWADVYALRGVARTLREGPAHAGIPPVRTRLVRPLQEALRTLSARLQVLLEGQRILSDAVAHEIRTPLARMRFGVEMLRDAGSEHEREQLLDGILGDVLRLEQLAEAGIDYSRIGRMQRIDGERIGVRALFQQLRHAACVPAAVTVTLRGTEVGVVHANRAALQLALRNLLGNALRHARSQVQLSAERSGQWLVLAVDDDGPGVDAALRERIFQPYVQLQPHDDGFGLGLAIVQVIAEKHGGHADVVDSALGGARFRILLPPAASPGSVSAGAPPPAG
ncbi:ATP-binding protein [Stenotrophomonas rhizophila]|uniref:ATP-binding protein n=1 Tax=Stenotrophomonas rhizophila TaxID=216778 RepID=UPI001E3A6699|nr:ATP-binding protein [Stenotrophomonas rhizophila]MCC7634111.1 two-component sensor histidine kinase [Stenotrophomonas rhizophila]MCC7662807.1 two-component sensor histidine kinase [Stenotrophomonas rhizophila]